MRRTLLSGRWLILLAGVVLAACAGTSGQQMANMDAEISRLQSRDAALMEQQAVLSQQKNSLEQEKQQLNEQLRLAQANEAKALQMQSQQPEISLFPPNANPGQCFARLLIPGQTQTVTEKILKHEAGERIEVIPARYETVREQVLVEEGSQRLEVIPARYEWVEEQVLVKPATQRLVQVPATYETISEQIMVKPAQTVWKKGTGAIQRIDEATGEIMCLVEEPAQFRTVSKQVLKSPATTRQVEEPAVYNTVKKRVLAEPARTEVVEIPPKYKTVEVTKLVEPASERRIPIPAQFQTVTKQIKVSDDHMEWREILCDTNMTRGKIMEIQRALADRGYNPGPIDGVVGPQTMAAVNAMQKDSNLEVGKYLTISTVKALGVSPR